MKKYPVLKVKQIPLGFKNGEVCQLMHFDLRNKEKWADSENKKAYLVYVEKEIAKRCEDLFVLYRPEIIKAADEQILIAMKDNADLFGVSKRGKQMLDELNQFTDYQMDISYGMDLVMLVSDPTTVGIFKSGKMGDDYLKSASYLENIVRSAEDVDPKELSVITPFEEFVMYHGANR